MCCKAYIVCEQYHVHNGLVLLPSVQSKQPFAAERTNEIFHSLGERIKLGRFARAFCRQRLRMCDFLQKMAGCFLRSVLTYEMSGMEYESCGIRTVPTTDFTFSIPWNGSVLWDIQNNVRRSIFQFKQDKIEEKCREWNMTTELSGTCNVLWAW